MNAQHIRGLLRKKHEGAEWYLAFEVRNSPGAVYRERYADAIAMSVWPSRGFVIHGYEIKVSRSDWQAELRNPYKAEAFLPHVDYWWLVAPKGVALESEIPDQWGHMAATEKRLRAVKDAPLVSSETPRNRMDRHFVASLVKRRSAEDTDYTEGVRAAVKSREVQLRQEFEHERRHREQDYERMAKFKKEFEESLGGSLSWYYGKGGVEAKRVKEAVAFLNRMDYASLDSLSRSGAAVVEAVDKIKEQLKGAKG